MKFNIILSGVGGQGILTMAYFLDHAAAAKGYHFKQAEVHGMSQRGGSVYSHLRISDREILSDLIPEGSADMILSVEPLEVQRYLHLLKPDGYVISNDQPFINIRDYPATNEVVGALLKLPNTIVFNAKKTAVSAKSPKAQNTAILGAALPFLPFEIDDFAPSVERLFSRKGDKVVRANMRVFRIASRIGEFYKKLLNRGVSSAIIYRLLLKISIPTVAPQITTEIAEIILKNSNLETCIDQINGKIACTVENIRKVFN